MNDKIFRVIRSDRGSVLVVTLLILFALTAIGSTLVMISSTDLKISGNQRVTTEAFTVAEAGLNEAIHRLSLRNPTVATVGGWTGNVAISDLEPYDPRWEARVYLTDPGSAPVAGGPSLFNTGTLQNPSGTYLMYSRASGTDDVLTIRHKWEDRNGDGNRDANEVVRYDIEEVPPENFTSGFPVDIVTVTGQNGNALRTVEAEVTRLSITARTQGALYTDRPITISGTPDFCGHNHPLNTPIGSTPLACFAFHVGSGDLPGITSTGDDIDMQGAADAYGSPTPTDSSSSNPWYSLAEVLGISQTQLDEILARPDHTAVTNPMDGITYITGDAVINANTVGSGLLYVTEDATINGNFVYRGLIYVEGDVNFTGTAWILGTVIVKGAADYGSGTGTAVVLFSNEAIRSLVGLSMPAVVLSWREM
ncbi:MAG: pilus assembly PilX N-terminal domain-containing protein [Candidatus Krumholzibacteria bacterium]|nr:pilus assembly PilX N-terminal domain-containing protein [Candidatus Krumholzibacteria bacterium]